jgi:hypothetical protein
MWTGINFSYRERSGPEGYEALNQVARPQKNGHVSTYKPFVRSQDPFFVKELVQDSAMLPVLFYTGTVLLLISGATTAFGASGSSATHLHVSSLCLFPVTHSCVKSVSAIPTTPVRFLVLNLSVVCTQRF